MLNWRCVDKRTGEHCPHKHHSQQSARECASVMGFEDHYIETFDGCENKKDWKHEVRTDRVDYNRKRGRKMANQISPYDEW